MKLYRYGMKLKGFSPGCQPMEGFVRREDDPTKQYHEILVYDRNLNGWELGAYEFDFLDVTEEI